MIREIQRLREKYRQLAGKSEYISIGQVENDLYQLQQEARLRRIPKSWR